MTQLHLLLRYDRAARYKRGPLKLRITVLSLKGQQHLLTKPRRREGSIGARLFFKQKTQSRHAV